MTKPDYRAMCAELIERLEWFIAEDETNENDPGNQYWLTGKQAGIDSVDRARALLDQPVAEGPTDEELQEMWFGSEWFNEGATLREFISITRAVLTKWGHQ